MKKAFTAAVCCMLGTLLLAGCTEYTSLQSQTSDNSENYTEDNTSMTSTQINTKIEFTGKDLRLERLWFVANEDVLGNYVMETKCGRTFAAGAYGKSAKWKNLAFNRDTSYSGLLALNSLYPEEMLTSMKTIREVRLKLGWACYPEFVLRGIDSVQVHTDMTLDEFRNVYFKASSINKTDDVCWMWCVYDLFMKIRPDISEWQWFYDTALECFERLYEPFYCKETGLYYGQPTFIDVGVNGYPPEFGSKTEEARNKGVWLFASSTNSLYYKAMTSMAYTAELLGKTEEAAEWSARAESLRKAMLSKLRFADGTFTYFMYPDGRLEERREVLGTAFPVLCGVVEGEDARKCVANYPITEYGAPLITPFYEGTESLHNNSTWPFADTFLLLAIEAATGEDCTKMNIKILKNMAVDNHMYEFRNTYSNKISGQKAQLWTVAALLNTVVRSKNTTLPADTVRIY